MPRETRRSLLCFGGLLAIITTLVSDFYPLIIHPERDSQRRPKPFFVCAPILRALRLSPHDRCIFGARRSHFPPAPPPFSVRPLISPQERRDYLSAENRVGEHGCRAAVQRYASLEVLVWLLRDRRYTPWSVTTLPMPEYKANWNRGTHGFHDYWLEAEAIFAERCANIA
ncbi:hypothetical protein B0H14DRAFT_3872001 [Mycena olivaceomarginata]|nr:hypothetical protein B0H14DRAFT_3872001 [Mycena olivaceomarginata]